MQELLVFSGHLDVYARAPELIEKFLRVSSSAATVYRVTNHYAEHLEVELQQPTDALEVAEQEVVYAELDGGMIHTDHQWREVKLGRVFRSEDIRESATVGRGGEILHSEYFAHLGSAEEFTEKFRLGLDKYAALGDRLVFIRDGAPWMNQWIAREYSQATQILDFYHASEHLGEFASAAIANDEERKRWFAEHKALLLAGRVETVIATVDRYRSVGGIVKEQAETLQQYYRSNREQMRYDEYIKRGLDIGSGAIESAHRTVVHRRMKLSGQRWAHSGAQNVLNLRVASMSDKWHLVVNLIRRPLLASPVEI